MDPRACLIRALNALDNVKWGGWAVDSLNRDEAAEALRDLADWVEGGGFVSTIDGDFHWPVS